jgi:hypothetical protein
MTETDFLKLKKYNPETDSEENFNIIEALNENWDKVEAQAKSEMPIMVQDTDENKTYKCGIRVVAGKPQFIYEEVV